MLRVLIVHNRYQRPGGEDAVMEAEAELLERLGATVERFEVHNDAVDGMGRAELLARTLWNRDAAATVADVARRFRADVAHVHNTLPLLSPAVFPALREAGAATVLTLHNYRLICPGNYLLRDGRVCEDCVGKRLAAASVRHGCYRESRSATAAVAATTALHHRAGTWRDHVDRYFVLTGFARDLFVRGGLPAEKLLVKPNFVRNDPGVGTGGSGALFVGRLSEEKGVGVLLDAWRHLPEIPLTIVGDGPMTEQVRAAALPNVTLRGWLSSAEVHAAMRAADLLVFPSLWYEGMPITLLEAAGAGLPAVVSGTGAQAEVVTDGETGLHAPPGDAGALAAAVREALRAPMRLVAMRRAARARYEALYSPAAQQSLLLGAYREALAARHGAAHAWSRLPADAAPAAPSLPTAVPA